MFLMALQNEGDKLLINDNAHILLQIWSESEKDSLQAESLSLYLNIY